MVEGRLLLGSDWLVVDSEPCLPLTSYVAAHCNSTSYRLVSQVSGFGVALISLIVVIMVCCVSQCPLTWCLVSHDGLTMLTDSLPCLLMLQGILSRSIPHSYCTRIAVLTLVDDY